MPKDLFSQQARDYSKYRPHYPQDLFDYILSFVKKHENAWDCATGNGQAASILADHFEKVYASDISQRQLDNGIKKPNIWYIKSPAEGTPFEENFFDLITVAQAYHWLKWKAFREEAMRVGKEGCVISVWAYNHFQIDDAALTTLYHDYNRNVLTPYWDPERVYVDDNYKNVEFDYEELPTKTFESKMMWDRDDFIGYLSTFSAVRRHIDAKGFSPVDLIANEISSLWPNNEKREIRFPITLRIGRIPK